MKKRLPKTLFVLFVTLLCILIPAYDVMTAYSAMINNALNIQSYRVVESDIAADYDSEYFKADFSDPEAYAKAAAELCRQVEAEGLVLLTNQNGALPLPKQAKVSFFAQGAVYPGYGSTGSSAAKTDGYGSLRTAFEKKGFSVNGALWDWYAQKAARLRLNTVDGLVKTYRTNELPWEDVTVAQGESFANFGDAAIVVLTRDSGEGFDVSTKGSDGLDGSYLSITKEEEDLLKGLTELKQSGVFKRVIVLLNAAVPMQLDFLYRADIDVDACLWVGNIGMSGAMGIADVLAGSVNPSGRLTDTYTRDNFSSPAMASWVLNPNGIFAQPYANATEMNLNSSQQYYGVYVEGIYVGYRYYETRYEDYVIGRDQSGEYDYSVVAFPFGHGLSYTTFAYSDMKVTRQADSDSYVVTLTVTNTGSAAGREPVQIYLQKPYIEGGLEKASVELAGFTKTKLLQPGESETVRVTVNGEFFRTYDAVEAQTYVLDPGDYYLAAGYNAHDALNNILASQGFSPESTGGRMTAAGNASLAAVALHLDQRDAVTYAVAAETGEPITNLFDFADINRYEHRGDNQVTYLSRADWAGTWPKKPVKLSVATEGMMSDMASHKPLPNDPEAVSPLYNIDSGSQLIAMRGLPYDHSTWDILLDQLTYEEQALLVTNAAFGTSALDSIALKETKASDGPTAVSASITAVSFPNEGIWASSFDVELIERIGDFLAEDARLNGVDTMYAPGVNIHRTPFGGRAHEYFSEDPLLTAYAAMAEVKGMQKKGVIPVLKHYAFNDEESARNGIGIWLNEQAAREIYLLPFEYAMRPSMGAGALGAMSSFNRVGALWTGASKALQLDISRNEWNFQGYFITDMASSNGALFMTFDDGVFNGTDLFLGSGSKTALKEWKSNIPFRNRVREAVHRVLYVTVNGNAVMNGVSPSSQVVLVTPWWAMALLAAIAASAVIALGSVVVHIWFILKDKRSKA